MPAGEDLAPKTTYERLLPLARANDPEMQHCIGFMYFYGEGVELSFDRAHYWFHLAAEQGDIRSQRNLGIFHARLLPQIPEKYWAPREANLWFSLSAAGEVGSVVSRLASESYGTFLAPEMKRTLLDLPGRDRGQRVYRTLCAGCHGFDGVAPHSSIPSFAAGDRMDQRDRTLIDVVLRGKNLMPAWGDVLSEDMARATVAYIRGSLAPGGRFRTASSTQPAPVGAPASSSKRKLGEETYLKFCGGCHGFNGIATYVNSPSFALRERMSKSDAELSKSIKFGRGVMPSWEYMLEPQQIDALVAFIRTLAAGYEDGIDGQLHPPPDLFYRFRPKGETGQDWQGADPSGS